MDRLYKLKCWVYPLSFLGAEMFSAFCGITGYEQKEESSLYLYFMMTLFFLSMFLVVHDIFIKRKSYNKTVLLIPVFFTICYFFDVNSEQIPLEWTIKSYQFFIFFSLPSIMIASIMAKSRRVESLYKNIDLIMFVLGVGMIAYLPKMVYVGEIIKGYNNISYQSALALGYLYYGLLSKREDRYAIFKTKLFRIISIVMCIFLALTSLASGGRGGVVFLLALVSIISFIFVNKKNIMTVVFIIVPLGILSIIIIANFVHDSVLNDVFDSGIARAFSYLTSNGIDMSQTSNRDIVYEVAMKNIEKNPYTGYGIFHTIGAFGYPHNIFLEMIEGGGLCYFFFWIIIIVKCFSRGYKIVKSYSNMSFLIPLFLYPCTMLLFSGSYVMNGPFWFFVCYSLCFKKIPIIEKSKIYEKTFNSQRRYFFL